MEGMPQSYKPLVKYRLGDKLPEGAPPRPAGASEIYVYDPEAGTGHWLEHYHSDKRDGVEDSFKGLFPPDRD